MIDFYRSGRLLDMISLASCDTVYLAGEGAFKLSKTSSTVLCDLLAEAGVSPPTPR
jgi:hypothetical protein